jgi:serine/threonine protein kinase
MAMNEAGWMHRDVSAGNCLLSCDPADGPSFVSDIELSKRIDSEASASETAISVSGAGSTSERSAHHTTQGTAQFMARELLKSMENQQDSGFVHLPQHDLESLVYVLAYAVMTKECGNKPVKNKDDRKLLRMKVLYHETFGESTFFDIKYARSHFVWTWTDYQSVVAGDGEPSVLHDVIGALLVVVNRQYPIQKTNRFLAEADKTSQPAVPLDAKLMRRLFKRGIADEKAYLNDASSDSDVDAGFD